MRSYSQEPPPTSLPGQQPSVVGTWTYNVQASEITEAGEDFSGTYESASNQLVFNRNPTWRYLPNWNVNISKSDALWHSHIKLWIRRTGDGNPVTGATISNGANYIEIINTSVSFFNGYREMSNVPFQLKITGISAIIPVNIYSTAIIFTITEY